MKISALWITKNEEANIARSIESCKAIADEMIVVDTGSTDDTVKIAEGLGARIEHFDWINDFAAARNFALKQTDAEVVIFLDADEWFEPALGKKDRVEIEKAFKNKNIFVLETQLTDIDPQREIVMGTSVTHRVIRGRGKAAYIGAVHEYVDVANGQKNDSMVLPGLNINHVGYANEAMPRKIERNMELLGTALEKATTPEHQALYHYYLMREYINMNKSSEGVKHLRWLIENTSALKAFMHQYPTVGQMFPVLAMRLAKPYRPHFNRRQLRKVLVDITVEMYPRHPLSKVMGLYFDVSYNNEGEVLLEHLKNALEQGDKLAEKELLEMNAYNQICRTLDTRAGETAWLFGDRETAFDYAAKAIRLSASNVTADTVSLLLRSVKGLPIADVVVFLNSMLPTDAPGIQQMLLKALKLEGYADLYTYYIKKMMDGGKATKGEFWYLMILLGRAEEACTAAMEAKDTTDVDIVQQTLFLAVACTGDIALFEQYKEEMGRYREPLDLMFYQQDVGQDTFALAITNYRFVAFAGGRAAANRLITAYSGLEREAFIVQGSYYTAAGLYVEFLDECLYQPAENDLDGLLLKVECELMCGRSQKALEVLEVAYEKAGVSDRFFNLCAALVRRGSPEVAAQARAIYDTYRPAYSRHVDYKDVVNTEIILDADGKKQRKDLTQMTPVAFDELVDAEELTPFPGQLDILRTAAGVYVQHKVYTKAVDCLVEMLHFQDTSPMTYTTLAEIFVTLENESLAEYLRQRAQEVAAS